jgi:hypothetical protein
MGDKWKEMKPDSEINDNNIFLSGREVKPGEILVF